MNREERVRQLEDKVVAIDHTLATFTEAVSKLLNVTTELTERVEHVESAKSAVSDVVNIMQKIEAVREEMQRDE